jgi:hypothetical protein
MTSPGEFGKSADRPIIAKLINEEDIGSSCESDYETESSEDPEDPEELFANMDIMTDCDADIHDIVCKCCREHHDVLEKKYHSDPPRTTDEERIAYDSDFIDQCCDVFIDIMAETRSMVHSDYMVEELTRLFAPFLASGFLTEDLLFDHVKHIYLEYLKDRPDTVLHDIEMKYCQDVKQCDTATTEPMQIMPQ